MTNEDLKGQLPLLLPRLWRFALRLTRNTTEAEDLVQRCCLRAWERREQYQPGTALLSWMFSIMHTTWLNELRSAQRRREAALDWEEEEAAAVLEGAASYSGPEQWLLCRQVVAAVQALPEAQRLVMLLVAVEGLSYRETSDVLKVPIGTVMSRLARARIVIGQKMMQRAQPRLASTHKENVREY